MYLAGEQVGQGRQAQPAAGDAPGGNGKPPATGQGTTACGELWCHRDPQRRGRFLLGEAGGRQDPGQLQSLRELGKMIRIIRRGFLMNDLNTSKQFIIFG